MADRGLFVFVTLHAWFYVATALPFAAEASSIALIGAVLRRDGEWGSSVRAS